MSLKTVINNVIIGIISIRHGDFNMYSNLVPYFNSKTTPDIAIDVLKLIY
jgi:hypothetical protein